MSRIERVKLSRLHARLLSVKRRASSYFQPPFFPCLFRSTLLYTFLPFNQIPLHSLFFFVRQMIIVICKSFRFCPNDTGSIPHVHLLILKPNTPSGPCLSREATRKTWFSFLSSSLYFFFFSVILYFPLSY